MKPGELWAGKEAEGREKLRKQNAKGRRWAWALTTGDSRTPPPPGYTATKRTRRGASFLKRGVYEFAQPPAATFLSGATHATVGFTKSHFTGVSVSHEFGGGNDKPAETRLMGGEAALTGVCVCGPGAMMDGFEV